VIKAQNCPQLLLSILVHHVICGLVYLSVSLQVLVHSLGEKQSNDVLLFEEKDPACFVGLTRTKDWKLLLINSHSKLSSEVCRSV
jgi:hypothetical protein